MVKKTTDVGSAESTAPAKTQPSVKRPSTTGEQTSSCKQHNMRTQHNQQPLWLLPAIPYSRRTSLSSNLHANIRVNIKKFTSFQVYTSASAGGTPCRPLMLMGQTQATKPNSPQSKNQQPYHLCGILSKKLTHSDLLLGQVGTAHLHSDSCTCGFHLDNHPTLQAIEEMSNTRQHWPFYVNSPAPPQHVLTQRTL